jgi:hypothetical protein
LIIGGTLLTKDHPIRWADRLALLFATINWNLIVSNRI